MKDYSMKPTYENALKMFDADSAERNQAIARFINLLDAIDDECIIALNGDWGSGKTFFVKQVKMFLDASNPMSDMASEDRDVIINKMKTQKTECSGSYATVYYDAWANDNTEDPILSFIYEALKDIHVGKPDNQRNIVDIVAAIADFTIGASISNLVEKIRGSSFFMDIKGEQQIHALMKSFIDNLI
jgi:hypothetical protein